MHFQKPFSPPSPPFTLKPACLPWTTHHSTRQAHRTKFFLCQHEVVFPRLSIPVSTHQHRARCLHLFCFHSRVFAVRAWRFLLALNSQAFDLHTRQTLIVIMSSSTEVNMPGTPHGGAPPLCSTPSQSNHSQTSTNTAKLVGPGPSQAPAFPSALPQSSKQLIATATAKKMGASVPDMTIAVSPTTTSASPSSLLEYRQ